MAYINRDSGSGQTALGTKAESPQTDWLRGECTQLLVVIILELDFTLCPTGGPNITLINAKGSWPFNNNT